MVHRIRVNFSAQEFEVEGPSEFVERTASRLETIVGGGRAVPSDVPDLGNATDGSFGQILQEAKALTGTDKFLVAGHFVQQRNGERLFTTAEANELLKEQGVKLGNPSQTAANLLKAKLIFRERGKFRVSKQGEDRLRALESASD